MAVLTINSADPTRDHVRRWMETRGYDFPVLWGGGFATDVGVVGFPTTWVVDPEGRLAFQVVGGTMRFAEEFGWRIEAVMDRK